MPKSFWLVYSLIGLVQLGYSLTIVADLYAARKKEPRWWAVPAMVCLCLAMAVLWPASMVANYMMYRHQQRS